MFCFGFDLLFIRRRFLVSKRDPPRSKLENIKTPIYHIDGWLVAKIPIPMPVYIKVKRLLNKTGKWYIS